VERITQDGAGLGLTLAFVWNRNPDKLKGVVPDQLILEDLSAFKARYSHAHVHSLHQKHNIMIIENIEMIQLLWIHIFNSLHYLYALDT